AAIVEVVAAAIAELELPLVVLDPVIVSSSGRRLLDDEGVQALCAELLDTVRVVTPNVPEAEVLSGRTIHSLDYAREAARDIHGRGAAAVIITGGHALRGSQNLEVKRQNPDVVDLLFDGHDYFEFRVPRVESRSTHGTGCTYASAIAASLALGRELP